MAEVTFRESALSDLDRHDAWRATLEPPAPPIAEEIVLAILAKLLDYADFRDVPYSTVTLRAEALPVKRLLVHVRSKTFVVFVGSGVQGGIEVARVRHPGQQPLL